MNGKIICELLPNETNTRNSEGAFITLKNNDILFAYSRYGAQPGDNAAANLYGMISRDNGESFGEPFPLCMAKEFGADNLMSVSFLRMQNDDIGMFFLAKSKTDQCICYLMRSADEGKTWGEPVLCSDPEGYFVVNNDRALRLADGTVIVPSALHKTESAFDENGKQYVSCMHPGELYFFVSEDDGRSFHTRKAHPSVFTTPYCNSGLQEPCLTELHDGSLWCLSRTGYGSQYELFSKDQGKSWTEARPSYFTSPCSPLCMKRLSDDRLLAIWNPIPLYNGRKEKIDGMWTGARTPLAAAASTDDGKTFSDYTLLETDEERGFCYTAIHELSDGSLLLAYCAGGVEDKSTLCRLRIRKLSAEEVSAI